MLKTILVASAFAASAAPTLAALNLVTNGDFEDVNILPLSRSTSTADAPGWTFSGTLGDGTVWRVGYADGSGSIMTAGHGQQFITMGGGASSAVATTAWSQPLHGLTPGTTYQSSFMIANEHSGQTPQFEVDQTVIVSFVGSSTQSMSFVATPDPSGLNYWRKWQEEGMQFVASTPDVVLQFQSTTPYDVGLDNVRVTQVPEPEIWAVILASLLATGLFTRTQR